MATAALALLVLCLVCHNAEAQVACSMPAPFSNGNGWLVSQGNILYITSATAGILSAGGANYTVMCDGQVTSAVNTDYYGRVQTTSPILGTLYLHFCFKLETGTSSVMGFTYRTTINNIATVGQLNAQPPVIANTPATSAACDVTGTPAEYENTIVDFSSGSLTPITCPSVLMQKYTSYQVVNGSGSQCSGSGGVMNPFISTTSLTFYTTNCSTVATHFGVTAPQAVTAHCLRTFTDGNNVNFLIATTDITTASSFFCLAYSASGSSIRISSASRVFAGGICDNNQTSTWASGFWATHSYDADSSGTSLQQTLGLIFATVFSFFML